MSIEKYEGLPPPARIKKFDASYHWNSESIKYDSHPAYADFVKSASILSRMNAVSLFFKSMVPLLLKRLIKYELIPLEFRKPQKLSELLKYIGLASRNAFGLYKTITSDGTNNKILRDLQKNGCSVIRIPSDVFSKIEANAEEHFIKLDERRNQSKVFENRLFEESRGSIDSRVAGASLVDTINNTLKESGILKVVSLYLNRQARLVDVNPQINDKSDNFWNNIFPDLNLSKIPTTAYFHRDASGGDIKAIFYCSDVADKNGPFNYVLGSNNMETSRTDDLICEANDHNGMSGTDRTSREKFAALPQKFRQKCAFGNDLLENSDLTKIIHESLWEITGSKGTIVLFDTKGIHRGGMVVEGESAE